MRKSGNAVSSYGMLLLVAAAFMMGAAGCQTTVSAPIGGMVDQGYRISLQPGGPQAGTWDGMYVSIRYDYVRDGGKLNLKGKVKYADNIVNNYSLIDYFHLDALFLDAQGKVVDSQPLASTAYDSLLPSGPDPSVPFKKEVILPANAVAMAFSYKGQAIAGDDDSGGGMKYFWEYPVH